MYTQAQLIQAAQVLIYLRKSRTDDPSQSVEEVLAKHETELQEYAERELGGRVRKKTYTGKLSAASPSTPAWRSRPSWPG